MNKNVTLTQTSLFCFAKYQLRNGHGFMRLHALNRNLLELRVSLFTYTHDNKQRLVH